MKTSFIIWSLLLCGEALSQEWVQERTIHVGQPITSCSIDQQGQIYIGTSRGDIFRYLSSGEEAQHFSTIGNSSVTITEAWNRLKLYLFFRDIQQFSLLDRFTTTPVSYAIRDFQPDLAWLASPGTDNSIWMLASTYNELRKFNLQTKALLLATPLSEQLSDATYMRSYQNLTIISDEENGLYFFDQFGNLLYHLEKSGIRYFSFIKNQIVALTDEGILYIDPFQPETYEVRKAPVGAFSGVLVYDNTFFFIQETSVLIYRLKS